MEFTKSLIKGKLIKRYKRFFVDVKIGKEIVTAHCPNTGSMKGLLDQGNDVYLLKHEDPKRKLKYGLEIIKARKNLVGVNTHMANKIVNHGLKNNLVQELKNEIVTAHCPNTGSMKGLLDEGNEVYLLKNSNPKRKLKYGLEIIRAKRIWLV